MKKTLLTPKEKMTITYYDEHASEWKVKHAQSGTFGRLEEEFKLFFKLLPKGEVLEIGTGTGEDAIDLIKNYGLSNYVGIEPAAGLRKIAIENNPGAKITDGTVYNINYPDKEFDGFWACQVLIHVPKKRMAEALQSISRVVKPNGIGMITILEGTADVEESRPGRYYSLWQDAEFLEALKKNGYTAIHKRKVETGSSPWLTYIVRKHSGK